MMVIPANLRRQVITRAANCCEYCGLAQTGQEATFHIDHVVPLVAGGQSTSENLALACVSCSLRRGARLGLAIGGMFRMTSLSGRGHTSKGNPLLPGGFLVTGLVYDVTTGRIEIVVPPALLRAETLPEAGW